MGGLFNTENAFWRFMGKLVDAMILGIIWVICCIPIVTAGPATTACYYVTLKMVRDEDGYLFRSFLKSFRQNFKQSLCIWLIYLVVGVFFAFDIYYYHTQNSNFGSIMVALFLGLTVLYVLSMLYVFPIISKFSNTTFAMFRVSVVLPFRHFLTTVCVVLELLACLFVVYMMPPTLIFMPGVYIFVSSYHFRKIFDIYCDKIIERDAEEAAKAEVSSPDEADDAANDSDALDTETASDDMCLEDISEDADDASDSSDEADIPDSH